MFLRGKLAKLNGTICMFCCETVLVVYNPRCFVDLILVDFVVIKMQYSNLVNVNYYVDQVTIQFFGFLRF